jgi:hypothetical protein
VTSKQGLVLLDQDRRVALHCLETSFSQGRKWKALISKYIGTIPSSGDAWSTAEQSMARRHEEQPSAAP